LAGGWCWFVLREEYCWLVAGGWFVLREKYCWLMADKPSEQSVRKLTLVVYMSYCINIKEHEFSSNKLTSKFDLKHPRWPNDNPPSSVFYLYSCPRAS
jgi:hypothetical protein